MRDLSEKSVLGDPGCCTVALEIANLCQEDENDRDNDQLVDWGKILSSCGLLLGIDQIKECARRLIADRVVNCTGASEDFLSSQDPSQYFFWIEKKMRDLIRTSILAKRTIYHLLRTLGWEDMILQELLGNTKKEQQIAILNVFTGRRGVIFELAHFIGLSDEERNAMMGQGKRLARNSKYPVLPPIENCSHSLS